MCRHIHTQTYIYNWNVSFMKQNYISYILIFPIPLHLHWIHELLINMGKHWPIGYSPEYMVTWLCLIGLLSILQPSHAPRPQCLCSSPSCLWPPSPLSLSPSCSSLLFMSQLRHSLWNPCPFPPCLCPIELSAPHHHSTYTDSTYLFTSLLPRWTVSSLRMRTMSLHCVSPALASCPA